VSARRTRHDLHAVAELLMAGPQYRTAGTIRLRVTPGGFGTVAEPHVRVDGGDLVAGQVRLRMAGTTLRGLADAAGLDAGAPADLYADGSGALPEDPVEVDEQAAAELAQWLATGEAALRSLAPDQTPVLWPEHFDLAITVDKVNYGISPGDAFLAEPYAYVGPWTPRHGRSPRKGDFWNAPFGAARRAAELADAREVAAFFAAGRAAAAESPAE
jgi:hypothetical protein